MHKLRSRLPIILSATALIVAVFGATPVGNAVTTVLFAKNAGKVDGIDAAKTPKAGDLLALNGQKKFPASVVGGISSFDVLDGAKCTRNSLAGTIDLSYSNQHAVLTCVIPILPDAHEPNDDQSSATGLMFQNLDFVTGTLPVGDQDWFTFTCQNTMMPPLVCSQHNLFITADSALFDVYQGPGDAVATAQTEYVIDPLTSGEQIWLDVYPESSAESYNITFSLGDVAP